jgi:heat-inducible transcriptional repressor
MNEKSINERALAILKAIVERYIREGQPVGSKALAEDTAIALSSATIRNIMSDLEASGYLRSPHTSAGRIPTVQGYRLFVDSLLTVQPLEKFQVQQLRKKLNYNAEPTALVETASSMLSSITKLAGVVTLPKHEHFALRQIEFLPLTNNRVLVVLVLNDREIQNRVICTEKAYSLSELQQAGNYLTQTFAGKDLFEIRQEILGTIGNDREHMKAILQSTTEIVEKAFEKKEERDYVLAGESNLLALAEEAGIGRLRSLFEALTKKGDILHLLDACLRTEEMQIFIGMESGYEVFDDCSIVSAPYSVEGKIVGVLGVIGPTRMDYDRVISAVDVTAKLLSAALSDHSS